MKHNKFEYVIVLQGDYHTANYRIVNRRIKTGINGGRL